MQNIPLTLMSLAFVFTPTPAFAQNPFDQMRGIVEQLKNSVEQSEKQQQNPTKSSSGQRTTQAPAISSPAPISEKPAPITGSAESGAIPSCSQIRAFGADRNQQWREKARASFFGKPLADYSTAEINNIFRRARACDDQSNGTNSDDAFAIQKIGQLRDIHRGAMAQPQAEATKTAVSKPTDDRQQKLKAGQMKVAGIQDAELYLAPVKPLPQIMYSPLLRPDNAIYGSKIIIDAEERSDLLRGTLDNVVALRSFSYVFIRLGSKAVIFSPEMMRLGATVSVIGKYVGNQKYRTGSGQEKTAPLLELMYLGAPPDDCLVKSGQIVCLVR